MALTQVDQGLLSSTAQYTGFKNRIINGAMVISQRGTSFTTTGGTYTLDRFYANYGTNSKFTIAQSSTAPAGFSNSMLITSSSAYSLGASDYFGIIQPIEGFNTADLGWGTASAKTVTLSFQVYSSLTGTFGGALFNSAQNRSYPFSYTIASANTWTSISITIAGDTSGTWVGATNGIGINVNFNLGTGSTYSGTAGAWASSLYFAPTGATSVVGTNGATWYVTGVQLEKGSTATSFDYRPFGTELQLCQRYCVNYNSANASGTYFRYGLAEIESTTIASQVIQFLVQMRATPTLTTTGTAANYAVFSAGSVVTCTAVPSIGQASPQTTQVSWTTAASLTAGRAGSLLSNNNNTSYLIYSAEL